MAWTAPMTFVGNQVLTGAQMNLYLRDNMLLMAPNLATTEGSYFMATGANTVAERTLANARVSGSCTATATTFGNPATGTNGPSVDVVTGTSAIVFIACRLENNTTGSASLMSYAVTGATAVTALIDWDIQLSGVTAGNFAQLSSVSAQTGLTPGTNTFTCQYRVSSATTGTYSRRFIAVMPL